jgi:glutamate-1-semialdehyde aminotransferase
VPDSAGVPADFARNTLTLPLNDFAALDTVNWREIACVIIEPIPANMGLIPLKAGFLEKLRKLTGDSGALLILDEVISGFRVARGGAQELYGIQADLTTLGKIIGGGLPVGAFGGRADVMDLLAPVGPVYQAGTLSGNPLAMAAGIATLEELSHRARIRSWNISRPRCATRMEEGCEGASGADRVVVLHVLHGPRGGGLCQREDQRHKAVWTVLSRDAGARRVPGAVAI